MGFLDELTEELFGRHECKKYLHIIRHLEKELSLKRFHAFFFIQTFNNQKNYITMGFNLTVGGPGEKIGIQIIDLNTGQPLPQAVASNQQYSIDNPAIVSAVPDTTDPTEEDIAPVAAGTANLSGSVTADLSAYGLGTGVVLPVAPAPVVVAPAPPPPVNPGAVFVAIP